MVVMRVEVRGVSEVKKEATTRFLKKEEGEEEKDRVVGCVSVFVLPPVASGWRSSSRPIKCCQWLIFYLSRVEKPVVGSCDARLRYLSTYYLQVETSFLLEKTHKARSCLLALQSSDAPPADHVLAFLLTGLVCSGPASCHCLHRK